MSGLFLPVAGWFNWGNSCTILIRLEIGARLGWEWAVKVRIALDKFEDQLFFSCARLFLDSFKVLNRRTFTLFCWLVKTKGAPK